MTRLLARAVGCAIFGALAGAAAMILFSGLDPRFTLEMTQDRPGLLRGFYPGERDGDLTFAWTAGRAELPLAGLDRNVAWTTRIRVRGGRRDPATLPTVTVLADNVPLATRQTTNTFEDLEATIPAKTGHVRGVTPAWAVSNTFVPGPTDGRALGVQIDRLSIEPETLGAFPPRRTVAAAALGSAVFGAIFGALAATATTAVGAATVLAVGQAAVLRIGLGPFAPWLTLVELLAASIGIALLLIALGVERWRHERLRHTARFALMFTGSALYLQLLVLLHPDMPLGQGSFVDPIGLQAAALPLAGVIPDRANLLWILAAAIQSLSVLFFYWMVARGTGDRLAAAVAVAVVQLMPIGFHMLAHARLTAVLFQAAVLVALSSATGALLSRRQGEFRIAASAASFLVLTALLVAQVAFECLCLSSDLGTPVASATALNRAPGVLRVAVSCFGWPFLALAVTGLVILVRAPRERWSWLFWGWVAAATAGMVVGAFTGMDVRPYYAAAPPLAVLAARGVMTLWNAGSWQRALAVVVTGLGASLGIVGWLGVLGPALE